MFFVFACEFPFKTREPENPTSNQSKWIQPTSPMYAIINLKSSIAEKNITNYLRCLADTSNSSKQFKYIAEPSIANIYPSTFQNWGKSSENIYLNQLMAFLPKDSTSSVTLSLLQEDVYGDSAKLVHSYRLMVEHSCNSSNCPHFMKGQCEFWLAKNAQDMWHIYRWMDFSTGDDATWSVLRAYFGK
jgi:hypothetical protein